MLEMRHIRAGYHDSEVLRDVSLTLEKGRVTVLLGPNGSGKSTMLRVMTGQLKPVSGEILLDGKPLAEMTPRDIARKIAFLPQDRTVPQMTARRLVLHGRFPYIGYPRSYTAKDREIADEALRAVGASAFADMPLSELSGGQRQSVYLAMTLAQQTETVLMDEPTSWLDMAHQFALFDTAKRLANEGKAVLIVLHDLPQALRLADRVALLADGVTEGSMAPEELYASGRINSAFRVRMLRIETDEGPEYIVRRPVENK